MKKRIKTQDRKIHKKALSKHGSTKIIWCHMSLAGRLFVVQQLHICIIPYNGAAGRKPKPTRHFSFTKYQHNLKLHKTLKTKKQSRHKKERKKSYLIAKALRTHWHKWCKVKVHIRKGWAGGVFKEAISKLFEGKLMNPHNMKNWMEGVRWST